MSEAKFTKGRFSLMAGAPWNVLAASGIRVARCDFDGDVTPEVIANAQLFSAAPELYEALEKTLSFFETIRAQTDDPLRAIQDRLHGPIRERIRSVLAKARGEH